MPINPKVYAGTTSSGGIVVGSPAGLDGEDGDPGLPGQPGQAGTAGAAGANGSDGAPGARGFDGIDGEDGSMGPPGVGTPGASGAAGNDGAAGARGFDGTDGDDGCMGIPGVRGEPGTPGVRGFDGVDGDDGDRGTPGTAVPDFIASGGASARGLVPDPGAAAGTTRFLREDATWQAPTAVAADPAYAPGSFILATGTFRVQVSRLKLIGAQRATLQGTARVRGLS